MKTRQASMLGVMLILLLTAPFLVLSLAVTWIWFTQIEVVSNGMKILQLVFGPGLLTGCVLLVKHALTKDLDGE